MKTGLPEIRSHTALRGIAALCVVLYHCVLFQKETGYLFANTFARHSYIFVDLFFMLSGFILYYNYSRNFDPSRTSRREYSSFLRKRFVRIYPNYLCWFLVSVLVVSLVSFRAQGTVAAGRDELVSFLMHLAMVQSLFQAPVLWNIPLWSIAVEMIAYVLFPLLVIARYRRAGAADAAFLAFALLALGIVFLDAGTIDVVSSWQSVLRCLGGFVTGLVIGANRHRISRIGEGWLSAIQITAVMALAITISAGAEPVVLGLFCVLVLTTGENRGVLHTLLRWSVPNYLGRISFSIYLAHVPVIGLYSASFGRIENLSGLPVLSDWLLMSTLVVAFTLLAASASYHLLERPSQRWLTRRLTTPPA